jgi:hypothetical protein
MALLTQLDRRIETWVADGDRAAEAGRANALIQMQVLRDWHDHQSTAEQSEEREWCAVQIGHLRERWFSDPQDRLWRLGDAIPVLPVLPPISIDVTPLPPDHQDDESQLDLVPKPEAKSDEHESPDGR